MARSSGGAIIGGVGGGLLNLVKQTAASLICEEYVPSIGELGQSVALGLVSGGIGGGIGGALSRGILGPLGRGPLSAAWNNLGTQESILGISAISGWAADVTLNALTR